MKTEKNHKQKKEIKFSVQEILVAYKIGKLDLEEAKQLLKLK